MINIFALRTRNLIGTFINITRSNAGYKKYSDFLKNNSMESKDNFDSWKQPPKKEDSFLTGLYVANSLFPSKLVNNLSLFHFKDYY